MSDETAAAATETPISQSEFARRRGVTPGRVSQWVSEGKISGEALAGEGRGRRIIESLAVAQLRAKLDVHQRLGNGVATRLNIDPAAPAPSPSNVIAFDRPASAPKAVAPTDEVGEKIRLQQLEGLQRRNRREAIDEEAAAGRFTDADAVRQAMGRLASQMMVAFEGALPEIAAAIAAKFQLSQRDVLHEMRNVYRDVRAKQAAAAKTQTEALPAAVEAEIAEPELEPA